MRTPAGSTPPASQGGELMARWGGEPRERDRAADWFAAALVIAVTIGILLAGWASSNTIPPGAPQRPDAPQRPQPTCPVTSGIEGCQ
jgi:hypothetical protein